MKSESIRKIEKLLGSKFYFSKQVTTGNGDIEIYHCHNQPLAGCCTYITSGLQEHSINEILMHCRSGEEDECLEAIALLAFNILSEHKIIRYGTTIGGLDAIPTIQSKSAFYFVEPIYFESLLDSKYVWALPIFSDELNFILNSGTESFNDVLNENENIDMLSINRLSACA